MMDEAQVKKVIRQYLSDSQYSVGPVPFHDHGGVTSNQLDPTLANNAILYYGERSVSLTVAQILALNTTPITLIPAVGITQANGVKNSVIIVEGITGKLSFGTQAYVGGNNLEFRYTNGAGTKVTADMTNTFLNSSADAYAYAPAVSTGFTPVPNSPIVVSVPVANPTAGNSTLSFSVNYRVVYI